jgi:hypothetical protein
MQSIVHTLLANSEFQLLIMKKSNTDHRKTHVHRLLFKVWRRWWVEMAMG